MATVSSGSERVGRLKLKLDRRRRPHLPPVMPDYETMLQEAMRKAGLAGYEAEIPDAS